MKKETEKAKAKELIIKFQFGFNLSFEDSKKYAILTAKEILEELKELPRIPYNERRTIFYEKVLEEIKNH